jgi:putative membrane-bound dehydrogenase-like protein
MSRRVLAGTCAATCGVLILTCLLALVPMGVPTAEGKAPQGKDTSAKEVFGLTKVWAMSLEVSAKEYEAMQPPPPKGFGGPPPQPPKDKPGDRPRERNLFGTEFPWAQGDFTADGKSYKKVGLRYAGDGSYFAAARNLKRPFHIELSRFEKQDIHGLQSINLHAGTLDATRGREALAFAIFRAAGVPAPRTAFAEVSLTVPGKYDKEYLGLYTVVENVDKTFLADRFQSGKGLLLKPSGMRGLDYLGDDWAQYTGKYRPQGEPTKEQAKRVIDFARLINQGSDEQFRKEIGSYLDVDAFLRFLAANALVSNLESFFALGHNYYLYLHPETNKFIFIPGDLELALANFAFMGSPEQQMDLSLAHPYGGDNKLADRLLAGKEVSERYGKLLKELSANVFTKERLLKDVETIEKTTKELIAKDAKAAAARKEGPGGFGPPGGKGANPPDLRTFVDKRTASIVAQLDGKSKGFVPQFGFGPPGGGGPLGKGPQTPVDDKTIQELVKAPADFDVTLFAAPPTVSYPVALAAGRTGELFVAVDEQGSLGRTAGGGKVLRLVDRDGKGKADKVTVFAKMEHPRGVIAHNNSVWVLHPPYLTVFHDDDGDGVADRQEVLVSGLTTDMIDKRGGDHTTNGIRMGIDGWIYITVGDYGIVQAKGKDGTTLSLRGGGILRVRPDGTELEVFATGLRNVFDFAIDPELNLFSRDNTNDGAGWDTRVSHLIQTAHYGYTQLYANFTDEIMPPLGAFGQGGATGGLFVQHPQWPQKYDNILYTGDWGRSEVYRHELKKNGATFDLKQEVFLKFPRPTGMDIDAAGHLYVASWRGGEASVYVGPNVGFIARITPRGLKPATFPNLKDANLGELMGQLAASNAVLRLHTQREILRRGPKAEVSKALAALAADTAAPLHGRIVAIFTLLQLDGKDSRAALLKLAADETIREFALRALTDRKGQLAGLDAKLFVAALTDVSPRVRAQALISLGRLDDVTSAKSILPLTARPKGSVMPTKKPVHEQPDPDRVLPHLAVRALVSLKAVDACLEALDGPHRDGALWALRYMHDNKAVEGLIKKLGTTRTPELRLGILTTLVRLYYKEADYKGSWWGIRPDSTGPYYDRQEWELSKRIGDVLTSAFHDGDGPSVALLRTELPRHKVSLAGVAIAKGTLPEKEKELPILILKADPKNPDQIGNLPYEVAVKRTLQVKGDAGRGKALFKSQSCSACHTDADGQTPKGPHLVDIGKRSSAAELVESILQPSAKIAQGFETYTFVMKDGRLFTGFVVTESAKAVQIREANGLQRELMLVDLDARQIQKQSAMPDGLVSNLTPPQLADLLAYVQSLK